VPFDIDFLIPRSLSSKDSRIQTITHLISEHSVMQLKILFKFSEKINAYKRLVGIHNGGDHFGDVSIYKYIILIERSSGKN
jgi:lipid II:glycine glycyltransferase (peptidoglycan interpeptide bridge formation enzyme)